MVPDLEENIIERNEMIEILKQALKKEKKSKNNNSVSLLETYLKLNNIERYLLFATKCNKEVSFTYCNSGIEIVHIMEHRKNFKEKYCSFIKRIKRSTKCKMLPFESKNGNGWCIEAAGDDVDKLYEIFIDETLKNE